MTEARPVELQRSTGDVQPALELVGERRVVEAGDARQPRTVAAIYTDGEVVAVDIAQDRVTPLDGKDARMAERIIGERLEVAG